MKVKSITVYFDVDTCEEYTNISHIDVIERETNSFLNIVCPLDKESHMINLGYIMRYVTEWDDTAEVDTDEV